MAEYIEREALLSELQEEIDFETSMYTEEQNKYFNMGLKCAVRDVKSQPTADVVPKSEVDKLKIEIEALKIANEKMYAANKAQAREIFEEIEKLLECCFSSCYINAAEEQFDFYRADFGFQISELKKKYTE